MGLHHNFYLDISLFKYSEEARLEGERERGRVQTTRDKSLSRMEAPAREAAEQTSQFAAVRKESRLLATVVEDYRTQ